MNKTEWLELHEHAKAIHRYDSKYFGSLLAYLEEAKIVVPDKKVFSDSSIQSKIEEAKEYLVILGVPESLINKMGILTFLALCNITPETTWCKASKKYMGLTKDIMPFVGDNYNLTYKANTRESFRKDGINLLLNYEIIDLNPGKPFLGPNSPLTHYAVKDRILTKICNTKLYHK